MPVSLNAIVLFVAGLALMLYGYRIFMKLLPVWGFFTGFFLGADLMAQLLGQGFLDPTAGWVVGVVLGGVFAAISATALKLGMALNTAGMGYGLGINVAGAMGIDGRLIVLAIALVMAGILVMIAIKNNLRVLVLIVMTTTSGVLAFVASVMLFTNAISPSDLQQSSVGALMAGNGSWPLLGVSAAILGLAYQFNANASQIPWARKATGASGAATP